MARVSVIDPKKATVKKAVAIIKDIIRDLEVFAEGRGTSERYWAITSGFWKVYDLIDTLNPHKPTKAAETVDAEVLDDPVERQKIAHQKPLAITHVKAAKLF